MLEGPSWSRHPKPYAFNKYVKYYEAGLVAVEVLLCVCFTPYAPMPQVVVFVSNSERPVGVLCCVIRSVGVL